MKEFFEKCGWNKYLKDIDKEWYLTKKGEFREVPLINNKKTSVLNSFNLAIASRRNRNIFITRECEDNINKYKININNKLKDLSFYNNEEIFFNIICVKIINSKKSTELFGYSNLKKKMERENNIHPIMDVLINFHCKDSIQRDVVVIESPSGKNLKFILEDLEFIYPDVNTKEMETLFKGYIQPLDRTIKKGRNVKILANRQKIPYGTKGNIKEILPIGNNTYCKVLINDKLHIISKDKLKVIA